MMCWWLNDDDIDIFKCLYGLLWLWFIDVCVVLVVVSSVLVCVMKILLFCVRLMWCVVWCSSWVLSWCLSCVMCVLVMVVDMLNLCLVVLMFDSSVVWMNSVILSRLSGLLGVGIGLDVIILKFLKMF